MSSELKLGPARDFERDPMIDLWTEEFGDHGDGEHEREMVDAALDRDTSGVWAYTIGNQDKLLAFDVVTRFPIEDYDEQFPYVDTSDFPKATDNGCIYMVCVRDDAKNHGYAKTVIRDSYRYFWNNDIRRVWATCWHREDHVDSRRLFDSLGYEKVVESPTYYDTPEGDPDRNCPDCGTPCDCPASHWTAVIDEDDLYDR